MNTVPVSNAIADTFAAHLDALAAADPARALLIDPDGAVSAAELRARAVALAAGLARLGLQPGQRVAIWLPNCAAWVESFLPARGWARWRWRSTLVSARWKWPTSWGAARPTG